MAGVIYLDVDDEITSAAARIRSAAGTRVAVVLPNGSRVATSRINFRLLARDAMTNGKILSVVAPDGATRALAASAGLPVFSTVGEYESSEEGRRSGAEVGPSVPLPGDDDDEPMLVSETVATPAPRAPGRPDRPEVAAAGGATIGNAAASGAARIPDPGPAAPTSAPPSAGARIVRSPAAIPAARVVADTPDAERERSRAPRPEPSARFVRPSIGRTPLLIGLAVLGLALVVGGAGAYLFLPTATARVSPRETTIGPESLRIVASTTATEPDPDAVPPVVPAELLTIPVEAGDTFPATGTRVEEANAAGTVRFENRDPTSSNGIRKGSIVSAGSGVRFRTDADVSLPAAELILGEQIVVVPSRKSVSVTAVDACPDGNVEPNTITTVPRGENPEFLKVNNPDATAGGKHDEFPRVVQDDVDAAIAELTTRLSTAFEERLADPALPGDAATVFPETKALSAPVFGLDPATLVGQEVETFELTATASGTVVAVDTSPVQTVAEARIAARVEAGYTLIDGSGQVDPAPAEISEGVITFPVVVTARQVLVLDTQAIKLEIMGKSLDQARQILATYGEADLTVWPDWVGTVPTLDSRVEVTTPGSEGSP